MTTVLCSFLRRVVFAAAAVACLSIVPPSHCEEDVPEAAPSQPAAKKRKAKKKSTTAPTPAPQAGSPAETKPENGAKKAVPVSLLTVNDEQFDGQDIELKDGQLTLKSEPPRSVRLDELQRITFAAKPADDTPAPEKVEGSEPEAGSAVTLSLEAGDALHGRWLGVTDAQLKIKTAWQTELEVPSVQVRGLQLASATDEGRKRYEERLAKPADQDTAVVLARDGSLAEIAGELQGLTADAIRFRYQDQDRSIKLDRLQGIVFAAHPPVRSAKGAFQVFRLTNSDVLSGSCTQISATDVDVTAAWGGSCQIPRTLILEILGRNGRMMPLSDLTPVTVEQVPYFDRLIPYVRDKSWNDAPLKIADTTYARGFAVHARCVLTFALDGQFTTFKTIAGFDESSGKNGRVVCRVLADGKELFSQPDLRATEAPQTIEVSVQGAKQLTLEVDFGEDQDVGDRLIWANPRLYRD